VRQWLLIEPELDVQQVGVMGFCMGGRFALLYGAQAPLAVVAPFYGMVPPKAEDLQGICPVVGGWGEKDMVMGKHGKLLNKHLDKLGVEHDVKSYHDAGHSYMNNHDTFIFRELGDYSPLRSKYNEAAAEDSWERVFAFFDKVL
jgi:carboxymethylenebutenolidase